MYEAKCMTTINTYLFIYFILVSEKKIQGIQKWPKIEFICRRLGNDTLIPTAKLFRMP